MSLTNLLPVISEIPKNPSYSLGNSKLGNGSLVISRPVGETCPSSCHFLHNGCYAENTERLYPNTRNFAMRNVVVSWVDIKNMIYHALEKDLSVRFMERGDWGWKNRIDRYFVGCVVKACRYTLKHKKVLPYMWSYTHFYSPYLYEKLSPYISLYASVHNGRDHLRATKAGFKLFAWIDTNRIIGRHKDGGNPNLPKSIFLNGERYITCPEMRRGRKEGGVTCTGSKKTVACNLCVKGLGNVLFVDH